jgi:hypothetical protein
MELRPLDLFEEHCCNEGQPVLRGICKIGNEIRLGGEKVDGRTGPLPA